MTANREELIRKRKNFKEQYDSLIHSKPQEAALFKKGIEKIDKQLADLDAAEKKNEQPVSEDSGLKSTQLGQKAIIDESQKEGSTLDSTIQTGQKAAGILGKP